VWQKLSEMLKDREPAAPQSSTENIESETPKKKMALLLMESDDEAPSTDKNLDSCRAEPSVSIEACPLQCWSTQRCPC